MGNVQSEAFSDQALSDTTVQDTQVMHFSENDFFDPFWLAQTYTTGLSEGLVALRSTQFLDKRANLRRKARDADMVLESVHQEEFKRRALKYLQKEMVVSTDGADPYGHTLRARCALLARVQLAYVRMQKRQILGGKFTSSSHAEKISFLRAVLDGNLDAFTVQLTSSSSSSPSPSPS
eukprot:CAMPEP_0175119910 /NCGR_PEP_ID=MMETSP0087-20121206/330_1 /TAXON_ID=136419 /ORGANISM="Unknown Unknown, Strain D1" /LENGTH=177 /DNA_ID=CAMNT_0016401303 /DNA_START=33 /DNA_END=563 /DNA_ORIENTATION=+